MTAQKPALIVVEFRPLPNMLLQMVRAAAMDSANVKFSEHSLDRMDERSITTLMTLRVLREGTIKGPIEPGRAKGEWKCKIVKTMKGVREVGVITVVMSAGRLFVKTVEWENLL